MTQRSNKRYKYWLFTINNPEVDLDTHPANLFPDCKYLIYQLEQGENGTFHFQGYVVFNTDKRIESLKRLHPTAHFEVRRGTHEQAKEYCSKEDTRVDGPWEFGDDSTIPRKRGARTDLIRFRDMAPTSTYSQLLEEFPDVMARYPKFTQLCKSIKTYDRPPLNRDIQVSLYWGEPGTGKTRRAYEIDPNIYVVPISDKMWFDGYNGEETILIDDFTGWMKLDLLLRLLDRYPIQMQVKGSFTWLHHKHIIVTSNKFITEWYDWKKHGEIKYRALRRRFHEIIHYNLDGTTDTNEPPFSIPEDPNLY